MTPARLREVLTLLRWSQRGLADILECDERMVRRWAAGSAEVPASLAEWLESVAAVLARLPVPTTWRTRRAA